MKRRYEDILSPELLREVFDYDLLTGVLTWKFRPNLKKEWYTKYLNKPAGSINSYGYLVVNLTSFSNDGRQIIAQVSRVCWAVHYGIWPTGQIDHKDRNTQNNSIANLRDATCSQNRMNAVRFGETGLKGVHRRKDTGKFTAKIQKHGRIVRLGQFDDADSAASAYDQAAAALFGEFARLNGDL